MDSAAAILREITAELTLDRTDLRQIAAAFCAEMKAGLAGQASSLKLLPSFLHCPSGRESGQYLALDFGGTNVRAQLVELQGGAVVIVRQQVAPLRAPDGRYDYGSRESSAEALFDFLAELVTAVAGRDPVYNLGHTFSFPCRQITVAQAELLSWTKEIATPEVEGQEVGALLQAALNRRRSGVFQKAILNDTVATLLAAAYNDPTATIGSICGTGHNTCYREPDGGTATPPMIRNLESGNFAAVPMTEYDRRLDAASEKPGTQRLEKMVGGHYLGEIVRMMARDLAAEGLLFTGCRRDLWQRPYELSAAAVGRLLDHRRSGWPEGLQELQGEREGGLVSRDREILSGLAAAVSRRSAQLAAATFAGIIQYLDPRLLKVHAIGIDGSLYAKMPHYAAWLQEALVSLLDTGTGTVRIRLVKDGSGVGAAIAAALVTAGEGQI